MIGTEPRRPTQETSAVSLRLNPKSASIGATANGLASNTRTSAITNPSTQTSSSETGSTSRPRTTNIVIWLSHARPSMNRKVLRWKTNFWFPIITPATKIARNPLPPRFADMP